MHDIEPRPVPLQLSNRLTSIANALESDPRIVGVAIGGSYLTGAMDEFSDLDLVVFVESASYGAVLDERRLLAASLGSLLGCFTGEHVGEPRLLICLYGDPLMHVDLKFVDVAEAAIRVEDPVVLWERDGRVTDALMRSSAVYPQPGAEWIEERFWIWVHYGAARIGRGELFEALDHLAFLRSRVLGPLALQQAGARPSGVRRIEMVAPEMARRLEATIATHSAADCCRALRESVDIYRSLRPPGDGDRDAERAAMRYLAEIEQRVA